jgi:hypothetical protein
MIFEIYLVLYYIVQILTFVLALKLRGAGPGGIEGMFVAVLFFTSTSIHTVIMVSVFVSMMVYSKPWKLKHTIAIAPLIILAGVAAVEFIKEKDERERPEVLRQQGNVVRS